MGIPPTLIPGSMALALLACAAPDQPSADISVGDGWARATAPGQAAAAVYLTIVNRGEGGDRLERIEAAPGDATLHSSSSADGIARMRPLADGLAIAPRSRAELKPGGTHIMLTGLEQPLRPDETIQLTLGFARSGPRPIAIRVVGAGDEARSSHGTTM